MNDTRLARYERDGAVDQSLLDQQPQVRRMDAHRDCNILQTFGSPQGNGDGAPRSRSRAIDDYCIILTGVAKAEMFNGTRLEDD